MVSYIRAVGGSCGAGQKAINTRGVANVTRSMLTGER